MALEIIILDGVDIVEKAFNAVASFVKNDTWFSLVKIAEVIGILMAGIVYIKGQDLRTLFYWLLAFVLVNAVLLTPKERVLIVDLANPTTSPKPIDNVPLGVALPLYLSTNIGYSIAQTYDLFFHSVDDVKYSKTGLLFGQRLLEESFYIKPSSDELKNNINNYVQSCVIERNMIKGQNSFESLVKNKELITTLYAGSPADYMSYNKNGVKTLQSCAVAGKEIANEIKNYSSSDGPIQKIMSALGLKSAKPVSLNEYKNKISNVQDIFIGSSKTASDIFTQNMLVNSYRHALEHYPAALDGSSELIAQASEQSLTKMKLAHHASYQVAGKTLPALHTVFLTMMIGIFPIMALAMFIREISWGVVKNYLAVLFSLMMWPVLFAIFNSIITTLTSQVMHGQAFTIQNMDKIKENASMIAGMASWLMLSIPFLSFKLVTNLGQNIASAGSYLGNALAGSTSADAANTAAGNYNWGNMQMNNINGNKTDLNYLYRTGMQTVQNQDGSTTTTTANGQFVHNTDMGMSRLPFKIDALSSISSALANSASVTQRESAQYQQGFRHAMTDAYDNATQLSKNLAHNVNAGNGLSSDTKAALDKTYKELNNFKNNEGSTTQNSIDITAQSNTGVSTSVSAGTGILGKVLPVSANAQASTTNNDIRNDNGRLGTNNDVSLGYEGSKSEAFSKIKSLTENEILNIQDQDTRSLVRNLQASLRSADENWNSFVASQAKEKAISDVATFTQTNSFNISDDYSQRFANYAYRVLGQEKAVAVLSADPTTENLKTREALLEEFSSHYTNSLIEQHQLRSSDTLGKYGTVENVSTNYQGNYEKRSGELIERAYKEGINENPTDKKAHLVKQKESFNRKEQEASQRYDDTEYSHRSKVAKDNNHIRNNNKNAN